MAGKTILFAALCALLCGQGHAVSTKKSVTEIHQRLERVEQILQSQGLLDMLQQVEALQQEVNRLRGEIEVQNHTLEQLNKRQRALYTDVDTRLQQLEEGNDPPGSASDAPLPDLTDTDNPPLQTLAPVSTDRPADASQQADSPLTVELVNNTAATDAAPVTGNTAVTPVIVETTTDDISALETPGVAAAEPTNPVIESNPVQARTAYQQAFRLLKQSLYAQAIKAFREFLSAHPDSDYSDNAQYWLGEAYYVTQQFEQALQEYNKLLAHYPESQKLNHALLKIGYSHHELGNIQQALALLEDLKQKYPGTTSAQLADDRLQKIRAEQAVGTGN